MITKYNTDDSFFKIKFKDASTPVDGAEVLSLNIIEELRKMTTGSVNLNDKNDALTAAFRPGMFLEIEWGYQSPYKILDSLIPKYSGDYVAPVSRTGLQAIVTEVSGKASDKGEKTITLSFRGGYVLGSRKTTRNYIGTRGSVILEIFARNGVIPVMIIFDTMGLPVANDLMQNNETDFAFLKRLARLWKTEFYISNDISGNLAGVFADSKLLSKSTLPVLATGAIGSQHTFDYKGGTSNVISYTWKRSFLADGQGDNVRFIIAPGGIPTKVTTAAIGGSVVAYELDSEKLFNEQERISRTKGFTAAANFVKDILSTSDFLDDRVQRFYRKVDQPFAPQGSGYEVVNDLIGQIKYCPTQIVKYNLGFPPELNKRDLIKGALSHKIFKVEHTLSSAGYRNKITTKDLLWR